MPTLRETPGASAGFEIEGDEIVLRITFEQLAFATENSCPTLADVAFNDLTGDWRTITVTDTRVWAEEVIRRLNDESEDGTTAVHRTMDQAILDAYENGAEGIEIDGLG